MTDTKRWFDEFPEEQKTQRLTEDEDYEFFEEQKTQSGSPSGETSRDDRTELRAYLELHTPKILASMEMVADEQQLDKMPETMCQIFSQSVIPFLLGGCGSISAGLLLTHANKQLMLLQEVPEFLVLMPPLQGLRGNLDMTFSSRMGTLAHSGAFERPGLLKRAWRYAAAVQALSVFVCIVVNLVAMLIVNTSADYSIPVENSTDPFANSTFPQLDGRGSFLFLTSASLISMAANCAICITLLFSMVYLTWNHNYNPDNIVAPLGASVSDLLTIGSMLLVCYSLRPYMVFDNIVPIIIIFMAVWSIPAWIFFAWKDETALKTAKQQCITLVVAALVSCGAGLLQSRGALRFPNYPAYQTLISGLTGNRGAVLASRISSYLEVRKESELSWQDRAWPLNYYCSPSSEAKTAKLLLCTALPFQLFFAGMSTVASLLLGEPVEHDYRFFIGYAIIVIIQQSLILYFAQLFVFSLWTLGIDPDIHAIPLVTSAADLFGCGLLYLMFLVLNAAFGCVKSK